ncbi:ribosomal RNA small subunit methyltransferase RsmB/transcription antitermination factor NusB [Halobacteroides halobius DSM 5150]|uniref:16S rRNA (cytosine(967)-C(5))-methyltransferase n=1 Tax=Halobacteroides halobius (strain ATCC 35273 / DSM 5150 / MD-1) TaxID=748449 RepID=L0K777_HALHC|nr:16S rRNA (cytosine(967)-C(5))-methyltransferase RsmB [Halobacteroides halobius]AGB40851.1 ribosomal RNA small subunit methyltransferase RsmB/transcription antitermination factor NusB [Halobacteroides halobius DSM 5150]
MKRARSVALQGIYRINEEEAYSNLVVNKLLQESNLDKRDRSLATQLIYGVTRWRNSLDWVINQFANRKVKKMTPWVRNALRLGVYQINYLDRIPNPVACNETVEVAKAHCNRGAIKFINGILRNIIRNLAEITYPSLEEDPVQYIRYKYSQPQWLVQRWRKYFGTEKTIKICQTLNQIPPMIIRTNTLKLDSEQLISKLEEEGISAKEVSQVKEAVNLLDYPAIASIDSFQAGNFIVQGLSSMLVAHLLKPQEDDLVVDLCSAPGGKTTHLAQVMENRGQINAVELHKAKVNLIKENCQRLGINNVEFYCDDGREISFTQQADKILVDAPCSGLGIMAKKPEIRWHKKPQDLKELQQLQLELLNNAASFLKPGGELLYTVCTFTFEETEAVVKKFMNDNPDFSIVDLKSQAVTYGLEDYYQTGYLKIVPDTSSWEGFFIAKLTKE